MTMTARCLMVKRQSLTHNRVDNAQRQSVQSRSQRHRVLVVVIVADPPDDTQQRTTIERSAIDSLSRLIVWHSAARATPRRGNARRRRDAGPYLVGTVPGSHSALLCTHSLKGGGSPCPDIWTWTGGLSSSNCPRVMKACQDILTMLPGLSRKAPSLAHRGAFRKEVNVRSRRASRPSARRLQGGST
jgi:hypothetical protein